jgi:general secretion pathway protein I
MKTAVNFSSSKSGGLRKDRGFTLLEVIVAFMILSLSLGAIYSALNGQHKAVRLAEKRMQAALIAQSRLDEITTEKLKAIYNEDGEDQGGFKWHVVTEKMAGSVTDIVDQYKVTVTVDWQSFFGVRHYSLTSLRLAPAL